MAGAAGVQPYAVWTDCDIFAFHQVGPSVSSRTVTYRHQAATQHALSRPSYKTLVTHPLVRPKSHFTEERGVGGWDVHGLN